MNCPPPMSCYFPVNHSQDLRGKQPVNAPKSGLEAVLSRVDIQHASKTVGRDWICKLCLEDAA